MKTISDLVETVTTALYFPNKTEKCHRLARCHKQPEVVGILGTRGEVIQENGMEFLQSILEETGLNGESLKAANEEYRERLEKETEEGLTGEINHSKDLDREEEIVTNCLAILKRHQYGYKGGILRTEDKLTKALDESGE